MSCGLFFFFYRWYIHFTATSRIIFCVSIKLHVAILWSRRRIIFETMRSIRTTATAIISLNNYWILRTYVYFLFRIVPRTQRWAHSEITFVPGGCSFSGLLLTLQRRSSPSFRAPRTLLFSRWSPSLRSTASFPTTPHFPVKFRRCSFKSMS